MKNYITLQVENHFLKKKIKHIEAEKKSLLLILSKILDENNLTAKKIVELGEHDPTEFQHKAAQSLANMIATTGKVDFKAVYQNGEFIVTEIL